MCKLISQYDGPEPQDKKTLEFCGIYEGTRLFHSQATVYGTLKGKRPFHPPSAARTLFLKNICAESVSYEFNPSDTVERLKTRVQDKNGIPPGIYILC